MASPVEWIVSLKEELQVSFQLQHFWTKKEFFQYLSKTFVECVEQTEQMFFKCTNVTNIFLFKL